MKPPTAVAHEVLPILLRSGARYYEKWARFFWRRGQHDLAALLLGQCKARGKEHVVAITELRLQE